MIEVEDGRKNYDERQIICYGMLKGPIGGDRLYPAWLGPPRLQHEEDQ